VLQIDSGGVKQHVMRKELALLGHVDVYDAHCECGLTILDNRRAATEARQVEDVYRRVRVDRRVRQLRP
jgi:hypothetical protein